MLAPDSPFNRTGYLLGTSLTGLVVVLIFLPPIVDPNTRLLLMHAFSAVCHQLPDRMMHLGHVPLAVCSRCVGLYTGLFVGATVYPLAHGWDGWLARHTGLALLVALGVPGIDWLAGLAALWESGHVVRLLTGAVFGLIAGYFLSRAAAAIGVRPRNEQPQEQADAASGTRTAN